MKGHARKEEREKKKTTNKSVVYEKSPGTPDGPTGEFSLHLPGRLLIAPGKGVNITGVLKHQKTARYQPVLAYC